MHRQNQNSNIDNDHQQRNHHQNRTQHSHSNYQPNKYQHPSHQNHNHQNRPIKNHAILQRCLYQVDETKNDANKDNRIRVVSYNILADKLLYENLYLYTNSDVEHAPFWFNWEYRKHLLLQQIVGPEYVTTVADIPSLYKFLYFNTEQLLKPDLIAFQELDHFDEILGDLAPFGYQGIFKKRTGDKHDGCAIFYKTDKLTLIDSHSVDYNRSTGDACGLLSTRFDDTTELFTKLRSIYLKQNFAENHPIHTGEATSSSFLDKDNIGLIALFQQKTGSKKHLVFANTHLLYNPKREDIKLQQIDLLLHETKAFTDKHSLIDPAMIFAGDFNSDPYTDVYKFMLKQELKYGDDVSLSHPFELRSALSSRNKEPSCTSIVKRSPKTVDYIFHNNNLRVFRTMKMSHLPDNVLGESRIPNKFHPSDHLLLAAEFAVC